MAYSFQEFCDDCRKSLVADSGPKGLDEVRLHLEKLFKRPEFLDELLGPDVKVGRHIVHHDEETDMYVLAHIFEEPGSSPPHDHGPYWVVYGNATGYTDMTEWKRLDDGAKEGYAEIVPEREYRLDAGMASAFRKGQIHSIRYPGKTRFVRVTGGDVEGSQTLRFDPEAKAVRIEDRSKLNRVASGR